MKVLKTSLFIVTMTLALLACEQHDPDDCLTYSGPPSQIISISQAAEMYNAYSDRRVPFIREFEINQQGGGDFNPTRYGEFSYETIKKYLAYIEKEADDAGVDISTLRIYLANYPDTTNFGDGHAVKYPKHNSFFIVPTTLQGTTSHAFYTVHVPGGQNEAVLMKDQRGNFMNLDGRPNLDDDHMQTASFLPNFAAHPGTNSLILNDAHLIPPPRSDDDMNGENN